MCHYFYNQVENVTRRLRERERHAHPTQRYSPWIDLGRSHIPCLAFDVWFVWHGRLHTVQIARSHDIYGAFPQNALGVIMGWARKIGEGISTPLGDLIFLSTSNNYRVADDGEAVTRIVSAGTDNHSFAVAEERAEFFLEGEDRDDGWYEPVTRTFCPDPPPDTDLDTALMAATLAAETGIGRRLRTHRGFDQIRAFADHLNAALRKNRHYRTQYGLLSPRDPWLDRDAEATDLLSLQLRNQLGRLHAAAVFVNSPADLRTQLSVVAAVQREAARLTDHPPGSVYVLNVLPQTAPEEPR